MIKKTSSKDKRQIRHKRIRRKVFGTHEHPRLSIFISLKNVYAQIIDDENGNTLVAASTLDPEIKEQVKNKKFTDIAKLVGSVVAKRAIEKGISDVVFDRAGYLFHGRVKALADEARNTGLKF